MPLSNVVGTTIIGTCQLETAADQCNLLCLYPNSLGIRRELFGYFPHLHSVPPFYCLPYLRSRWAYLCQKKVRLDFFFDDRKGEIDSSVDVSWFFAQCCFFARCHCSLNVVICLCSLLPGCCFFALCHCSSLSIIRLIIFFACQQLAHVFFTQCCCFFALCHSFFALCCWLVVLHTFLLFLCTESLAVEPYDAGDQPASFLT